MIDLREALIRKNREFDVVGFEIEEIKNFIINNYTFQIDGIYGDIGKEIFEFLDIKQINNKFIVNTIHNKYISIFLNQSAKSISDNLFAWGDIHGHFACPYNDNLTSLKGSPKICHDFSCAKCVNLKTLEGSPEKCIDFDCSCCYNLKTLEGSPEKCADFDCTYCYNLKTLEGVSQYVKGDVICTNCENLVSLKGCPKYIGGNLYIQGCKNLKTLKGISKVKYVVIDDENNIDDYNGLEDKIIQNID